MDNSEWRKKQKEAWPEGSLQRALLRNYPGCKSLSDALNKTILEHSFAGHATKLNSNNSPSSKEQQQKRTITEGNIKIQEPTELEKYLALRESIKSVEHFIHNGFDTWNIPEHVRTRLSNMPVSTIAEAYLWRDCWKAEIRKYKELSGDATSGDARESHREPVS